MRSEDRLRFDQQLVDWHDNLPWILRSTEPCPESLYTARCLMKWRYQNLRLVLYRPILLLVASRGNEVTLTHEEIEAVSKCRNIAKQMIEDIAREWTPNQMLGWTGVWFLYQASMIPLVVMFWESWNTQQVRECQAQIEIVLEALEGLSDWSLAARRSREVVGKMYEASKRPMTQQRSPGPGPMVMNGQTNNAGYMGSNGMHVVNGGNGLSIMNLPGCGNEHLMDHGDIQQIEMIGEEGMVILDQGGVWELDGMLWGNLPDRLDLPYDGLPMQFDDGGIVGFDGHYMMQP